MPRSRHSALFALITVAALALTGCADPAEPGASTAKGEARGKTPTTDVVSSVKKADAVAELLPEEVRKAGTLRIAAATGSPPGAFYEADGTTLSGADIDFADAVAKVLGVELKREVASFEAILPALGSGKYDLGTGNFGVTDVRRK
ncbi:transporter substrate-binding domain-containing protein, partial [Streptomyces microflavus]